jgi:hypothetical protein
MVMVDDPFETGFESDGCRSIHNGPAIAFVTPPPENFFGAMGF